MLTAIYPQKWLPYRYLGPFLRNHWDSKSALQKMGDSSTPTPKILILQAGNDELVPNNQGLELEGICRDLQISVTRHIISNALHTEIATKHREDKRLSAFWKVSAEKDFNTYRPLGLRC